MDNRKLKNAAIAQYGPAKTYNSAIISIFIIAALSVLTCISYLTSTDGYYTNYFFAASSPTVILDIAYGLSIDLSVGAVATVGTILAFAVCIAYAALGFLSIKFKTFMIVAAIVHLVDALVLIIFYGFSDVFSLAVHILLVAELFWAFFKGATKREAAEILDALEREQAKKNAEQSADNSDNEDLKHYFENK